MDSSIISEVPELDSGYRSQKSRRVSHPVDGATEKIDNSETKDAESLANTTHLADISIGAGSCASSNTSEDYSLVNPFTRRHIGLKQQINACKPNVRHDEDNDASAASKDDVVNTAGLCPVSEELTVPSKPKVEVPRSPCVVLQSKAKHHHNPHRTAVKKRWKYFVLDDVCSSSFTSAAQGNSTKTPYSTAISTESEPLGVGKASEKMNYGNVSSGAQACLGSDIPCDLSRKANDTTIAKGDGEWSSVHKDGILENSLSEPPKKILDGDLRVSNDTAENSAPIDLSSRKRKLKKREFQTRNPSVMDSHELARHHPPLTSSEMLRHLSNYWHVNQSRSDRTSNSTQLPGSFQEQQPVRSSDSFNGTQQDATAGFPRSETNVAGGSIPVIDLTLDDEEKIQPLPKRPRKLPSNCSCCSRPHENLSRPCHYSQGKHPSYGRQLTNGYNAPRKIQQTPSSSLLPHGYSLRDFKDLKWLPSHIPRTELNTALPQCVASTLSMTPQSQKVNSHYADPYSKLPPLIYCGSRNVANSPIRTIPQTMHQPRFNIRNLVNTQFATNNYRQMYFPHSTMLRAVSKPGLPTRLSSPTMKISNEKFLPHISQSQANPLFNK